MIKYWNPRRLQRVKARRERREAKEVQKGIEVAERARTYTKGDTDKNVRLMLNALGLPLRRNMIARLSHEGAMSLSKLIEPFPLFLSSGLMQLRVLERAGLVRTHKQGRVRVCSLDRDAFRELSAALLAPEVLKHLR